MIKNVKIICKKTKNTVKSVRCSKRKAEKTAEKLNDKLNHEKFFVVIEDKDL